MTRKRAINYRLVLRGSSILFSAHRGDLDFYDDANPVIERDYLGLRLARRVP